jgi:hypothetical protein
MGGWVHPELGWTLWRTKSAAFAGIQKLIRLAPSLVSILTAIMAPIKQKLSEFFKFNILLHTVLSCSVFCCI